MYNVKRTAKCSIPIPSSKKEEKMEIKARTLVACNMYGFDRTGKVYPPDQKRALGIVVEDPDFKAQTSGSFQVKLIYPNVLKGKVVGVVAEDLMPLAQTETKSEDVADKLPEIILSLAREINTLSKELNALKSEAVPS